PARGRRPGPDPRDQLPARPIRGCRAPLAESSRSLGRRVPPTRDAATAASAPCRRPGPRALGPARARRQRARRCDARAWGGAGRLDRQRRTGNRAPGGGRSRRDRVRRPRDGAARPGYTEFAVNRGPRAALLVLMGMLGTGVVAGPALANTHAHTVPSGVRIAGVRVGGLAPRAAAAAVRAAFAKPLPLLVAGTRVELHPSRLAKAYVEPAVGRARSSAAGTNVKLVVAVRGAALRATIDALERRFDRVAR